MKVKHLIAALELGDPEAEVYAQTGQGDGYFSLFTVYATQPDGHIGARGFVMHIDDADCDRSEVKSGRG